MGTPRVGRNAPCPCGSGRKYKHCCLNGQTSGRQSGLPVVCEGCGRIFEHPGFIVGTGATINAGEGARIGPHPGCGGYGRVAAGVYRFAADGLQIAFRSELPEADLRAIVALLERAHGAATVSGLMAELEAAPPWAKDLVDKVRKDATLDTMRYRIMLMLTVISIALGIKSDTNQPTAPQPLTQTEIDRIAQQIVRDLPDKGCWCGSGKRAAECHGAARSAAP
jgi:SEC-C motif